MVAMVTIRVKVRAGRSETLPHGMGEMAGRPEGGLVLAAGSWQLAALLYCSTALLLYFQAIRRRQVHDERAGVKANAGGPAGQPGTGNRFARH